MMFPGRKALLKPTLLITRRLPDRVLDAARARFDVTLRDADRRAVAGRVARGVARL